MRNEGCEVRSRVADEELNVPEPLAEGEGEIAGLLRCPYAGGVGRDAAQMHPAGAMLDEYQDVQSLQQHALPAWKKSTARIPAAWACRNCRQVGPARRGAESIPAARRISQTVDGATVTPSFVTSPWIRRYPHSEFSFASRTTRRAMLGTVGGRPGLRRLLVSYLLLQPACDARPAASLASQGRRRSSGCGVSAGPARRTTPGRPARSAPGRRGGAAPRSRAGVPVVQHPSPGPCGTPGRPSRVSGELAGRRS